MLDFLLDERRYEEAAEVADAMLATNPRDTYAMVKKGTAAGLLLQAEYVRKYPNPSLVPAPLRTRYRLLAAANEKAFRDAEALGWRPSAN